MLPERKWERQRCCASLSGNGSGAVHASLLVCLGRVPSSSLEDFASKRLGNGTPRLLVPEG